MGMVSPVSTPFLPGREGRGRGVSQKVASNQLKIGQRVAYRHAVIATQRSICGKKTLMGLQQFEHRFFFSRKITKTDLALEVVIKNLTKIV